MDDIRLTASRPAEIAKRLILTRQALERSQVDFARAAGISKTAFNNYEKGFRIGLDAAIRLCVRYELTLDWIYFGIKTGLSADLRERIANAQGPRPVDHGSFPSVARRRRTA